MSKYFHKGRIGSPIFLREKVYPIFQKGPYEKLGTSVSLSTTSHFSLIGSIWRLDPMMSSRVYGVIAEGFLGCLEMSLFHVGFVVVVAKHNGFEWITNAEN